MCLSRTRTQRSRRGVGKHSPRAEQPGEADPECARWNTKDPNPRVAVIGQIEYLGRKDDPCEGGAPRRKDPC